MTEETNTATPAVPAKPRAPKLVLSFEGKDQTLLKYPFPVKAAKFPVTINGHAAEAACTAGRGKAYTYLLFNNTSFYVEGTLPVDAAVAVDFPESYKFDEAIAVRVSSYKPKKPKAAPGEGSAADASGSEQATTGDAGTAESSASVETVEAVAEAPKAKRRGR